ncbi:MAG: hypothetical protein L0241_32225 [Planctomycetia bacterium]|nr:hypothetical protein [Planctomycetia bacterium]
MSDESNANARPEGEAWPKEEAIEESRFILNPLVSHRINLGPPWEVTPVAGGVKHARKFGWPRTLDANERLWLVCEQVPGAAEVSLNDSPLGKISAAGPFAAEITVLLQPRNEVVFSVTSDEPLGAVSLEVRPV